MTRFKAGQVAELAGVSVDTVRKWTDDGTLVSTRSEGGQRLVDGEDLACFLREQAPQVEASATVARSARNRFVGLVTAVRADSVMAQVDIQSGPHRVVSLLSREAVDELGLRPGVLAVASVKATNVVVELPEQ